MSVHRSLTRTHALGFKLKRSNKTLAVLIQGQTLLFSFAAVEVMIMWKEWVKDVCGRSALFFMRLCIAPRDASIVRLSGTDVRIHITVRTKIGVSL